MNSISRLVSISLILVLSHSQLGLAASGGTLDPKPKLTTSELEAGLSRYEGQTHFITGKHAQSGIRAYSASASEHGGAAVLEAANAPSDSGARRDVIDSDIFNVGPDGSKILVLLNGYRGLMILDFSKGADKPAVVGRVPATGNHPTNMYVDWKAKKALVIENWQRQNYGSGARILIYDLSDLKRPKLIQSAEVEGSVSDSRLVGDVLYVVGEAVDSNYYGNSEEPNTSYAKSFKISKDKIEMVETRKLSNHVSQRENMGIQEVRHKGGGYGYYITAVTSKKRGWWWSTSRSEVEVLDISSPKGAIKPLMVASVTGDIGKRSWVNIRNDALVVTSNYRADENNWQSPMRVAVETFKLPNKGMTVISERDAQFRELAMEQALKGNTDEAKREELLSNSELKLRGVFVQSGETLLKSISDFKTLDIGDTTGLSASVQDVRLVEDSSGQARVQIAWVPANLKDPLDIVDVTNVEERPVYQSRLMFDGWLERTIPLEFKGRHFVLGLGYITPAVDNPLNRRVAQAKLIEVQQSKSGKWTSQEIETLTLDKVQWSNVGGQDKLVSMTFDSKTGKGAVLFMGHSWSKNKSSSGGQTVEFDLAVKDNGAPLAEGPFIQGEEGWLRRVFMHPKLNAMMTFSDRELGVFTTSENSSSAKMVEAATRLELARNIVGYYEFPKLGRGLQVVSKGDYNKGETEVRIVPMADADAEKEKVAVAISIPGRIKDTWVNRETGDVLVLTSDEKFTQDKTDYLSTVTLRAMVVNVSKANANVSKIWENVETRKNEGRPIHRRAQPVDDADLFARLQSNLTGLVQIQDGWAFADDFNQIWKLSGTKATLAGEKVTLTLPKELKGSELGLSSVDRQVVLNIKRPLDLGQDEKVWNFFESWVVAVDTSKLEWTLDKSQAFNIPGNAQAFVYGANNKIAGILSTETRVLDVAGKLSEPTLNLTWIGKQGATLTSMINTDAGVTLVPTSSSQWVFAESDASISGRYGYGRSRPGYGNYQKSAYRLAFIDVDTTTQKMHRTVRALDSQLTGYSASVIKVALGPSADERRVVVSSGSNLQVVSVNIKTHAVTPMAVTPLNTYVEPKDEPKGDLRRGGDRSLEKSTVWSIPGYASSDAGAVNVGADRVQVAAGDYGVCEALLKVVKVKRN